MCHCKCDYWKDYSRDYKRCQGDFKIRDHCLLLFLTKVFIGKEVILRVWHRTWQCGNVTFLFQGKSPARRIMLLEQDPDMHCCRLHLRFAFDLLTTLLNPVEPVSPPSKIHCHHHHTFPSYGAYVCPVYLWWRRWELPPRPRSLCSVSQRSKHVIYYTGFFWFVKKYLSTIAESLSLSAL